MTTYRYIAYDLRTNSQLEELPLRDVSFTYRLNGSGGWSATLPLTSGLAELYIAATTPTRTAVYIERDGVLVYGGILWGRSRVKSNRNLQLAGDDWISYLARRTLRVQKRYSVVGGDDQFDIAADLIDWMQSQPGGDIQLQVTRSPTSTGRLRDRTYESWDRKNIGEAVQELSALIDGFDYAATSIYVAGVPERRIELSYPRRGRTSIDNQLVLETGKNIVNYDWPEDGARTTNAVDAIGAGDGKDMLLTTAYRTDLLDAGFPLLDDAVTFKDVTMPSTLSGHALSAVNARATPVTSPKITARADIEPIIGSWVVGDDVRIRIAGDEMFPTGLDETHRIVEATVQPDSNDGEIVTLTFAEVPTAV